MKHYTSIEQSRKLIKLGLSPETADMYWGYDDHYTTTPKEKDYSIITDSLNPSCGWDNVDPYLIPCWSLGALLNIIPNYQLQTQVNDKIGILFGCKNKFKIMEADTVIDTVFQMVVWLLENGYIKTEKK